MSTLALEQLEQSLENAARAAALADGLISTNDDDNSNNNNHSIKNYDEYINEEADSNNNGKGKGKSSLRRGKWTAEEEAYATRLINEFKSGLLPLTDGTTLRTFLSKLLNCDPMRISKKFVGQNCIGKQVFRRRQSDLEKLSVEEIETSRNDLAELERKFLERVVQTNRTKSAPKDGKNGLNGEENSGQTIPPWMMPPSEVNDEIEQGDNKEAVKNNTVAGNQQLGGKNKGGSRPKATKKNGKNGADSNLLPNHQDQPLLPRVSSVDYIRELVGTQGRPSINRINSLELLPNMSFDMSSAGSMENLQAYGMGMGMGNPTISSLWPSLNDLAEASKIVQASEEAENHKRRKGNGNGNRSEYQYVSVQSTTTYSNDVGYAIDSSPPLPIARKQIDETDSSFGQKKRIKTENGEYELNKQNGDSSLATILPKNSSVDNFWMLVNSGDIPYPSSSVLMESLISPPGQN